MTPGRRKANVAAALVAVSWTMVYGTWLAVDDMRAKPLVARATLVGDRDAAAIEVVNTGDFAWLDVTFTVNGTFTAGPAIPGPVAPGASVMVPLRSFVAPDDRTLLDAGDSPRELAASATRVSRFPRVNVNRPATGRWPVR